MMTKQVFFSMSIILFLSILPACGRQQPVSVVETDAGTEPAITPAVQQTANSFAPLEAAATETTEEPALISSLTPTFTPSPTDTPTALPPTDTSTPVLPPTSSPTFTPVPTNTSTPEPLPTATPTFTPVPPAPANAAANAPSPKKGLDIKSPPACDDVEALDAAWYLNWVPWPDSTCGDEDLAKFVPRLLNADYMQHLPAAIENAKASGWLIGFTEPNRPEQGNTSPEEAARLWKQVEDAADTAGIKLVSPSPVENDGEASWLWLMVEAYKDQNCPADRTCRPRFDAIGWNLYGCTNHPNCMDIQEMKGYLSLRRAAALQLGYDVPVWILEFGGCLTENSSESDKIIMREMVPWFNQTDWIGRYAWYSNRWSSSYQGEHDCILVNDDGSLTELGKIYQGL